MDTIINMLKFSQSLAKHALLGGNRTQGGTRIGIYRINPIVLRTPYSFSDIFMYRLGGRGAQDLTRASDKVYIYMRTLYSRY